MYQYCLFALELIITRAVISYISPRAISCKIQVLTIELHESGIRRQGADTRCGMHRKGVTGKIARIQGVKDSRIQKNSMHKKVKANLSKSKFYRRAVGR